LLCQYANFQDEPAVHCSIQSSMSVTQLVQQICLWSIWWVVLGEYIVFIKVDVGLASLSVLCQLLVFVWREQKQVVNVHFWLSLPLVCLVKIFYTASQQWFIEHLWCSKFLQIFFDNQPPIMYTVSWKVVECMAFWFV